MEDDDDAAGEVLAQPSFNDRLNILDFLVVASGPGDSAVDATDTSPAAVSLHTPTPPSIDDTDEPQFSFQVIAPSSTDYDLHLSQTITTCEYKSH